MAVTLKVREAAEVLGVSAIRVRELIADGRIKASHHPTAYYWMIDASELKRYVAHGSKGHGRPRAVDLTKTKKEKRK
jgi:excisionase family DNA binding protein